MKCAEGEPQPIRGSRVTARIASQYETFPFPPVYKIEQEDPRRNLRENINLDLGLGPHAALKPGSRVWVPGCGTRWAVMLALQLKDCAIVASDLSAASLAFQQRLATSLGVGNITFRREDLLQVSYRGYFDFISCVGVLHHLANPDQGFLVLERALAPNGILELMVYDRCNRHYSIKMRDILRILDPEQSLDSQRRFELALRLLRSLNAHAKIPAELQRVLKYVDQRPGFDRELADFISNPQEHYYDVPSLLAALDQARLRVWRWKQPHAFSPAVMLDDPTLLQRVAQLDSGMQAYLGSLLSEPLLEVYVCKASCDPGRDGGDEVAAYHNHRLRSLPDTVRYDVTPEGIIGQHGIRPKVTMLKEEMWFDAGERRPAVLHYGQALDCVTEEPRKRLRLADRGVNAVFDQRQLVKLRSWGEPGITPEALAERFFSAWPHSPLSRLEFFRAMLALCQTPFRVFALEPPG